MPNLEQKTTCDRCHADTSNNSMGVIDGKFYKRLCQNCIAQPFNTASREYERDRQREKNARDILQPWDGGKPNEKFVKNYPNSANDYFSRDEIKNIQ